MQNLSRVVLALLSLLAFFSPASAQLSGSDAGGLTPADSSNPSGGPGDDHHAEHDCLTEAPPPGFVYESPGPGAFGPIGDEGGTEGIVVCSSGYARTNTSAPLNMDSDFVPLTGDDAKGFYVVYSAKANADGSAAENNVGIYLFRLNNGGILMFGSGYGDPCAAGTALFDAAYDMGRIDQVIRNCMGGGPGISPRTFAVQMNITRDRSYSTSR